MKNQDKQNETVAVVGFNNAGYIVAVSSYARKDASSCAKYYRSIGYKARIMSYEELEELQDKEFHERMMYLFR